MNYYIDTEFLEGPQDKRFLGIKYGQTKPTIDLISLAIVAEDGRELYLISKDFNLREAWNRWQPRTGEGDRNNWEPREYWIRQNVLKPIWDELSEKDWEYEGVFSEHTRFTYDSLKKLLAKYGKTNKQIAEEVKEFCSMGYAYSHEGEQRHAIGNIVCWHERNEWVDDEIKKNDCKYIYDKKPAFYAYYADYDWVVFAWLFGRMIDLPKGFPMYCRDLKQLMDEKMVSFKMDGREFGLDRGNGFEECLRKVKEHPNYPKQTNEHSAIHDARWNRDLHNFIKSL